MSNESINAEEKQEPPSISSSAVPNASVRVISMADVPLLEVDWLWKPYIPLGKVTIIQGNPGEGKTTLALRLASTCSRGKAFHEMEAHEPFNVIYQTAEDGLGDTIKPRLIEAEADLSRVFVIDEADKVLSLPDERIEKAIKEKHGVDGINDKILLTVEVVCVTSIWYLVWQMSLHSLRISTFGTLLFLWISTPTLQFGTVGWSHRKRCTF